MLYFQKIKSASFKLFFRKFKSLLDRILLFISGFWAIPIVIFIRIISGSILIRFGTLRSDRIGHFASDSGQQFAISNINKDKTIDLYWLPRTTSNKQLEIMVRRNFMIFNFVRYLDFWNLTLAGGEKHSRPSSSTDSRDISGSLEKYSRVMPFLNNENKIAKEWLSSYGWKEGEPFVCLMVRDSTYLKSTLTSENDSHYSYHDYRDSNIDNFNEAIKWLANKNIWVLRMGRIMNKPLTVFHPKIIDYAFSKNQSDLLDVWLFANCNWCISTGSGPDMISDIYRKPILFLNYVPIVNLFSWSNAIHLPKHLTYIKTGEKLSLSDHIKHSYFRSEDYENSGIMVQELSSNEILKAVKEYFQNIETSFENNEGKELNLIFWSIIQKSFEASKRHGFIHKNAGIATSFLKDYPEWLK